MIVGLSADSKFALQFVGTTIYVGADIGVRMRDDSVVRYATIGGIASPTLGEMKLSSYNLASFLLSKTGSPTLNIRLLAAGPGAAEAAVLISTDSSTTVAENFSAAFKDANPLPLGC